MIAIANFVTTIRPHHAELGSDRSIAQCVSEHMQPRDAFIAAEMGLAGLLEVRSLAHGDQRHQRNGVCRHERTDASGGQGIRNSSAPLLLILEKLLDKSLRSG